MNTMPAIFEEPADWWELVVYRCRAMVKQTRTRYEDLAAQTGWASNSAVSHFLNGQRQQCNPAMLEVLLCLAKTHGVSPAWLLALDRFTPGAGQTVHAFTGEGI